MEIITSQPFYVAHEVCWEKPNFYAYFSVLRPPGGKQPFRDVPELHGHQCTQDDFTLEQRCVSSTDMR